MEPLYGRTEILTRARAWLARACAGSGRLVLFTGEPGIGKSRLAEQVALEASALGAATAWGRCWEAGGAPAYWPWIQVFRELDLNEDPFVGAVAALAVDAPEARFAAFDRAVRSLRERAAERPLLLVLDDLHAADAPSLLLLLLLARALARSPILVVGAYRDAELQLTPELAPLLAKLAREAELVPLARLDAADVATWMRDQSEESGVDAADLYRMTEGHPLFVAEALKLGRGAAAQAAWAQGPRGVLDERLGRLSAGTRAVLEVAAVLGREFSLDEVATTAPLTSDQAHDHVHAALREAVAIDIVVPVGLGRYRFSHVLLRDRLYAELLPSVRTSLHFQAGHASLARGEPPLSAVHHLFEGARAGNAQYVAEVALQAARASLSRLAFEDAVRIAQRALALPEAATALSDSLRAQLWVAEAEALINLGEGVQGKALCREVIALAERCDSPELRAHAALVYATELASGTVDPQMVALLRGALRALPARDSSLRVRVMARLSAALTPPQHSDDVPEILALMREALAMARRLPEQHALLFALQFSATVGLLVPELERFGLLQETLTLARALNQPQVVLHVLPTYVTALLAVGKRDQADAVLPEYTERLGDSRQPLHRVRYLLVRALLATLSGDDAEADALGAEARVLAQSTRSKPAYFLFLTHRMSVAQLRGDPTLLLPDGPAFMEYFSVLRGAAAYVAWFCAGTGRGEEALARLASVDLAAPEVPSANLWELSGAAETCTLLGNAQLGAALYPELERAADRMFWNTAPGALIGPSSRVLGDLALLLGRDEDAVRHYDAAIDFCEKLRAPALVERCQRPRAAALRRAALPVEQREQEPIAQPPGRAAQTISLTLEREGELWCLRSAGGAMLRLKHGKGFAYLQYLLQQPGREVHVLDLAGIEHRAGDAGPVLDAQAKAAYRERVAALREARDEAERFGDLARASRAEEELERLGEELARAVGLGGRDRRAASDVERVRINVQRRLKDAIDRIAAMEPSLGRYLAAAIKTGTSCVYQPL